MEFLGIGAPELLFILVLALIIFGPKDLQKTGMTLGRWLNQLVNSDGWRALQRTSREIRNLPTNLMRDANLQDLGETGRDLQHAIDPNWSRRRPPADSTSRPPASKPPAPAPDSPEAGPSNPPNDPDPDA